MIAHRWMLLCYMLPGVLAWLTRRTLCVYCIRLPQRVRQSQGSASLATRQRCNKTVQITVIIIGKNVGEVFTGSREEDENQHERTTPLSIPSSIARLYYLPCFSMLWVSAWLIDVAQDKLRMGCEARACRLCRVVSPSGAPAPDQISYNPPNPVFKTSITSSQPCVALVDGYLRRRRKTPVRDLPT